ncbi:hypothetical protein EV426DRAFT_721853 [Tirmania nivea]|nr:hypothetical protein EV426DRAFT_721853 [Tirmania nivea]
MPDLGGVPLLRLRRACTLVVESVRVNSLYFDVVAIYLDVEVRAEGIEATRNEVRVEEIEATGDKMRVKGIERATTIVDRRASGRGDGEGGKTVMWVKGHSGVEGNEREDRKAKEVA